MGWPYPTYWVLTLALMGVSIVMGVPQARWMVYFMENPIYKWVITRGTTSLGNLPMLHGAGTVTNI